MGKGMSFYMKGTTTHKCTAFAWTGYRRSLAYAAVEYAAAPAVDRLALCKARLTLQYGRCSSLSAARSRQPHVSNTVENRNKNLSVLEGR